MIRRFWTCFSKLWALPFIFVGGGLLTVLGMPVMSLFPGRRDEHALFLIRTSFRFYLWLLQITQVVRIRIDGREKLAADGGKVVVANHPSLLDVVILMTLMPRPQCIVKSALWNHRFLGGLMRDAGFIRNDLDFDSFIDACKTSILAGRSLIIFPEGTRSLPGEILPFQRGFANIALATACPVLPVFIHCKPPFLTKCESLWQAPRTQPAYQISVGEPLDASVYFGYGSRSLAARKLSENLEQIYAERVPRNFGK